MSNTVSPAELGVFLDTVASAPVALRDVPRMNSILARLVGLANAKHPIGEIVPVEPSTKYDIPTIPEGPTDEVAELRRRFEAMTKQLAEAKSAPLDAHFATLAKAGGTD